MIRAHYGFDVPYGSNRTFMELKWYAFALLCSGGEVLIVPLWN